MKDFSIKLLTIATILLFSNFSVFSQKQVTELLIGDEIREIEFDGVLNYKDSKIKLSDFKGKIIILDFWATWCAPCVAELPRLNSLQNKFKDEVIIIPISFEKKEAVLKFTEKRKELSLPFALGSEAGDLRKMFPHKVISHTIMINQKGVIVAITEPKYINESVIQKVAKNENISLYYKKDLMQLNMDRPLFLNGNGGDGGNALISSIITPYLAGTNHAEGILRDSSRNYFGLNMKNLPITELYAYAYGFDMIYRNRMLIKGSSNTDRYPTKHEDYKAYSKDQQKKVDNLYCYSLIAPYLAKDSLDVKKALKDLMKQDLDRVFGNLFGLVVKLQPIITECYIIKKLERDLDLKKIDEANERNSKSGSVYRPITVSSLEGALIEYLNKRPIVDETYVGGLKIYFKKKYSSYNNNLILLNQDLKEYGLEVIEGKRVVDMLVFKVSK